MNGFPYLLILVFLPLVGAGVVAVIGKSPARVVKLTAMGFSVVELIVAAALVLGSIPLFLGLVVVIPVLGHATWHLYRKLVVTPPAT